MVKSASGESVTLKWYLEQMIDQMIQLLHNSGRSNATVNSYRKTDQCFENDNLQSSYCSLKNLIMVLLWTVSLQMIWFLSCSRFKK